MYTRTKTRAHEVHTINKILSKHKVVNMSQLNCVSYRTKTRDNKDTANAHCVS